MSKKVGREEERGSNRRIAQTKKTSLKEGGWEK